MKSFADMKHCSIRRCFTGVALTSSPMLSSSPAFFFVGVVVDIFVAEEKSRQAGFPNGCLIQR